MANGLQKLKKLAKVGRVGRLKLHEPLCYRMFEIQTECMKPQTSDGVVVFEAVFQIAYNGMAQVLHVDTYLVLPACLQTQFYQRILLGSTYCVEMCDGIFASVVERTAVSEIELVVF